MALTDEEREVAIRWLARKGRQQNLRFGNGVDVLNFMIDNPLPSVAQMESDLAAEEAAQTQTRITNLRAELDRLEGR